MDGKCAEQQNARSLWERANRRAILNHSPEIARELRLGRNIVQQWLKASSGKLSPGERLVGLVKVSRKYKTEADAAAPLRLAAELLGYELRRSEPEQDITLEQADRAAARVLKETSEAAQALLEALEDGLVTPEEAAVVEKEIDEAILALNRARSLVRQGSRSSG